jgi:hypothetical protein
MPSVALAYFIPIFSSFSDIYSDINYLWIYPVVKRWEKLHASQSLELAGGRLTGTA